MIFLGSQRNKVDRLFGWLQVKDAKSSLSHLYPLLQHCLLYHSTLLLRLALCCHFWVTAHGGTLFQVAKLWSPWLESYLSLPKHTLICCLECKGVRLMLRGRLSDHHRCLLRYVVNTYIFQCWRFTSVLLLRTAYSQSEVYNRADCTCHYNSPLQHTSNITLKWFSFLIGATLDTSTFFENKKQTPSKIPVRLATNSIIFFDLFYYVYLVYVFSSLCLLYCYFTVSAWIAMFKGRP